VGSASNWDEYLAQVEVMANPDQRAPLLEIVENYRGISAGAAIFNFGEFLADSFRLLTELKTEVETVRSRATKTRTPTSPGTTWTSTSQRRCERLGSTRIYTTLSSD